MRMFYVICSLFLITIPIFANVDVTIRMNKITSTGVGKCIGTIKFHDRENGLTITTDLHDLPPGIHGFHVHENNSCNPANNIAGGAAGGHYDPDKTGFHAGPQGKGHRGDLPYLTVDDEGKANLTLIAPRLKTSELTGRSVIIHAEGDNYSDSPKKLGGGGKRIACGLGPTP